MLYIMAWLRIIPQAAWRKRMKRHQHKHQRCNCSIAKSSSENSVMDYPTALCGRGRRGLTLGLNTYRTRYYAVVRTTHRAAHTAYTHADVLRLWRVLRVRLLPYPRAHLLPHRRTATMPPPLTLFISFPSQHVCDNMVRWFGPHVRWFGTYAAPRAASHLHYPHLHAHTYWRYTFWFYRRTRLPTHYTRLVYHHTHTHTHHTPTTTRTARGLPAFGGARDAHAHMPLQSHRLPYTSPVT